MFKLLKLSKNLNQTFKRNGNNNTRSIYKIIENIHIRIYILRNIYNECVYIHQYRDNLFRQIALAVILFIHFIRGIFTLIFVHVYNKT